MLTSHSFLTVNRKQYSLGLFYKGTNSIHADSILMTWSLPKVPPQYYCIGGLGFKIWIISIQMQKLLLNISDKYCTYLLKCMGSPHHTQNFLKAKTIHTIFLIQELTSRYLRNNWWQLRNYEKMKTFGNVLIQHQYRLHKYNI
jgi:hypothetical protein